jgi:hypothetical protein
MNSFWLQKYNLVELATSDESMTGALFGLLM